MALPPGTRLGPYEILTPIGAGGMGEVYRGRDTRLDRDVAIKILPEAFAADPERLARFEREAKTLASLNHPHIAQVFGLESISTPAGQGSAIIMELVEGEDLADRLTRGALPLEDAVPIARQIAEAVEAAHDAGVVHRDLKPANVKVRADGTVKVLDFGLARAADPATGHDKSNSPTLTARATQAGMIIGTAAYMSPEQAKGRAVDKRADVWAFGCVVYELITGRRAFAGEDVSETLAAVLRQDVDWTALPAATTPRVRRLLERCLERDAKQRLRDIGEARVELAKVEAGVPDTGSMAMVGGGASPRRTVGFWIAIGLTGVIVAVVAAYAGYRARPEPEVAAVRFTILPPEQAAFWSAPMVSPDGRLLAFLADTKGIRQVWVRPLDAVDARPVSGTENAEVSVFWSPDSRSIGFFADGKMKRVAVSGGAVLSLADAPVPSGAAWSVNDVVIFSPESTAGLYSVPAAGGTPSAVTALNAAAGEASHRWPSFLPDGRRFLYYARHPGSSPEGAITLSSLDHPSQGVELLRANSHAVYARSPGALLFLNDRSLMVQAFDVASATLSGDPTAVAEGVGLSTGRVGLGQFSVSDTGAIAHSAASQAMRQFVWRDRRGRELTRLQPEGAFTDVELSPDGTRAAVSRFMNNNTDVWIFDLSRGVPSRFTFDSQSDQRPVWSADYTRIVFSSSRSGGGDLYVRPSNGSTEETLLYGAPGPDFPTDWSPDDARVLFQRSTPRDIFSLPLTGDRTPMPVVTGPADQYDGTYSPDGQWIAYTSNESTRDEVYLQGLAGNGGKSQVSTAGGSSSLWRRDGKELFYLAADRTLMAVSIVKGVVTGLPTPLFNIGADPARIDRRFAVSADGQRFLINVPVTSGVVFPVTVVLNGLSKK